MYVPENHPDTGHQSPYWYSDSPKGIRDHRRSVPMGRKAYKDLNVQPLLDADGICHWATAAGNGYRFLQVRPFKRRELTEIELHEEFKHWPAKKFKKLRRTKRAGFTYESHVRPILFLQAVRICKRYDTIPCFEIKSPFQIEVRAKRMLQRALSVKLEPIFMSLYKMAGIERKAKAFEAAGANFVILAHGEKKPIVVPPHTAIWGHFK